LGRFREVVDALGDSAAGLCLHAANSAATIDLPETHLDMVRPGIAIYGYQPSDQMHAHLALRPAMRLTGRLMQKKTLPAGQSCGYGLTYTFTEPTPVGLVPVGYADGYLRSLSNRATMRIRGQDVPVRGRVAMDQVIVDLSAVPDAAIGDEVEIISNEPADPHSVENLARLCGTIPYELTCRLGNRARRVPVP
ncbi:MAG: alanine racemase, partial [Planctomycetes bacterium]|nr:alanine racemase [Planctomycetota bacterium]